MDAGRSHTEHTFLLSTSDTVVDAYHDETPWGPCRPGVWRLSSAELDALPATATALWFTIEPVAEPPDVLTANARAMTGAVPALDIWLLGRSRLLYAARHDRPTPEVDAHVQAWLTLASKRYVAARRSLTAHRPRPCWRTSAACSTRTSPSPPGSPPGGGARRDPGGAADRRVHRPCRHRLARPA
ncbi:hypothetical protein [Amycolatopsis sp. EV170708-02-1]|uniref:hypothetical protein n=1 Tax=Amycolatopsis sp. EV170708-02-1 TaxID=2919322 RepID=UPI001F0B9D2A|nr:hypothetical protein [Amycolatopsis sp. EV170708-02-1]UMP07072.1 hypothetical protein MJQ72_20640 [Amycolatopsis sp. EV170708-02-1]